MGFSVDFQREVRQGDKFEMMYAIDRDSLSGMSLALTLNMRAFHYLAINLVFRYDGADSAIGWYDENGIQPPAH